MDTSTQLLAISSEPAAWLTTVSTGLANGALYALLAIALVTVYRTTGHLNFAQGEFAMLSAFLVFTGIGWGIPIWAAIVITVIVTGIGAALLQFGVMRPLERRGHSASLIAVLGMFLFVNAFDGVVWGVGNMKPLEPFPQGADDKWTLIGGEHSFSLSYVTLGVWGTLAALVAALWLLMNKTRLGTAYRAVISNRSSAALVGIPVAAVFAFGWALAAVPGTLAGVLTSQATSNMNYSMMINVLIFAFAAACIGGFDSIGGAVVGGLLVGLVESVIPAAFPVVGSDSGLLIALILLLIVLIVRPQGLFGKKEVARV